MPAGQAPPLRLDRLGPPLLLLGTALALRWALPAAVAALVPAAVGSAGLGIATEILRALTWAAGAFLAVRLLDVLLWHGLVTRRGARPPPRLLVDLVAALVWLSAAGIVAATVFRLPMAGIAASSGVAVAILGFALRDLLASLFSGVALNVERPYQIGDWIEVAPGPPARVVEVGWLTTRAVTRDGVGIVLPNAHLARQVFRNYSRPGPHFRSQFEVTLDYDAPPERVERLLLAAAAEVREVGPPLPAPDVKIGEFGPRGTAWLLRFWLRDYADLPETRYRLQRAVLRHLHQAGLALAYDKLDLFHAPMPPRALEPGRADEVLLARCDLFHPLDEGDVAALAAASRRRALRAGEILLRAGEPGASLFIVVEGVLDAWHEGPDGARQWLASVGAGGTIGEFSLLTGEPRSATVTAKRDALLLEIGRDALLPVLERRPELAEALGRVLAARRANSEAAATRPTVGASAAPAEDHGLGQRIKAFFGL
jgi:small-conductance mechanosensitive channel